MSTPRIIEVSDFVDWRTKSRQLLAREQSPEVVKFVERSKQTLLFESEETLPDSPSHHQRTVPSRFLEIAEAVACHCDVEKWNHLYHALWRVTHGEPHLFEISSDDVVRTLAIMEKQVRRDCHKMKAFVRFRRIRGEAEERYIAWHRPDHEITERVAPFFSRRFKGMLWSIFTPTKSAHWDGSRLTYGPGVSQKEVNRDDDLESLWKTYYRATFNPARIKVQMMKREMPVRHWPTLPEADLIEELLEEAPERVAEMIARTEGFTASEANTRIDATSLPQLADAAKQCRACDLCQIATQTVFGEGPSTSDLMLIGEQPGHEEDLQGRPFIGPAGDLLNQILAEQEIPRDEIYITNAVKHFHFEKQEKVRLHKKPSARHVIACKPWLLAEIQLIRPKVIVCLGATALQSFIGRHVRLNDIRGQAFSQNDSHWIGTWHPASILRSTVSLAELRRKQLASDLRLAFDLSKREPS